MVDRQDIDALLIGSLYGELSSTEEARLKAHLESHPADRTALAELTQTRETVRNRLLEVEVDPPASVSALLLQEAARRAPRAEAEREGWFARFMRTFLAHPAMAAAMMLVVVVGVAGTMYLRKGDHFAESTAPAEARAQLQLEGNVGSGAMAFEAAKGEVAAGEAPSPEVTAMAPAEPAAARGEADVRGYTVGLTEGTGYGTTGAYRIEDEGERKRDDKADQVDGKDAKQIAPRAEPPRDVPGGGAKGGAGPGFIEVTTDKSPKNAPVKELDDQVRLSKKQKAPDPVERKPAPKPASRDDDDRAGRFMDARAGAPAASPPPPPAIAVPSTPAPSQAPAQAPAQDRGRAAPDADAEWAKGQHARVVAQVRAGNCRDAASLAVTLSSRAPGYYAQHVESDRSIKECLALINVERDKFEVARRANQRTNEPAKATRKTAPAKAAPADNSSSNRSK